MGDYYLDCSPFGVLRVARHHLKEVCLQFTYQRGTHLTLDSILEVNKSGVDALVQFNYASKPHLIEMVLVGEGEWMAA